jgi:hypothetical protein
LAGSWRHFSFRTTRIAAVPAVVGRIATGGFRCRTIRPGGTTVRGNGCARAFGLADVGFQTLGPPAIKVFTATEIGHSDFGVAALFVASLLELASDFRPKGIGALNRDIFQSLADAGGAQGTIPRRVDARTGDTKFVSGNPRTH